MSTTAGPAAEPLLAHRHPTRVRYGVVGHGWRAEFYLRLARQVPDRFRCAGVVTRRAEVGAALQRTWDVPTFRRAEDLVASAGPEVVVTSVPRTANPSVIEALVGLGVAVLSETPPAADTDGLRRLWDRVGGTDLVQVAEQHPYLPLVSALRTVIGTGALGEVTSAQVSWTHEYHAMALLACLLGLPAEPARVQAIETSGPLLEGAGRTGRPRDPQVRQAAHTLALLQWPGRSGVYDFTEGQWFNRLRRRNLTVRGSHGEVLGDRVTWTTTAGSTCSAPVVRHQSGVDGDLEGFDLETLSWAGTVVYRNPYPGARLSDEEIAIATCLEATGLWRRGQGPAPYPLARACQDQALSLAVRESALLAEPVVVPPGSWSTATTGLPAGPA